LHSYQLEKTRKEAKAKSELARKMLEEKDKEIVYLRHSGAGRAGTDGGDAGVPAAGGASAGTAGSNSKGRH
jgi:hypothetical protein